MSLSKFAHIFLKEFRLRKTTNAARILLFDKLPEADKILIYAGADPSYAALRFACVGEFQTTNLALFKCAALVVLAGTYKRRIEWYNDYLELGSPDSMAVVRGNVMRCNNSGDDYAGMYILGLLGSNKAIDMAISIITDAKTRLASTKALCKALITNNHRQWVARMVALHPQLYEDILDCDNAEWLQLIHPDVGDTERALAVMKCCIKEDAESCFDWLMSQAPWRKIFFDWAVYGPRDKKGRVALSKLEEDCMPLVPQYMRFADFWEHLEVFDPDLHVEIQADPGWRFRAINRKAVLASYEFYTYAKIQRFVALYELVLAGCLRARNSIDERKKAACHYYALLKRLPRELALRIITVGNDFRPSVLPETVLCNRETVHWAAGLEG